MIPKLKATLTKLIATLSFMQILGIALSVFLTQSISFRVGNFNVTASENGKPVHLTFAQLLSAIEAIELLNKPGSFQIGSILITATES